MNAPRPRDLTAGNETSLPPPSAVNLKLKAPIATWDEAVPLGNGLMGGLLWGEGNLIRLSLDRGDLWDLRSHPEMEKKGWTWKTMQRLVADGNAAELARRFNQLYHQAPFPTKLPAGRFEIQLGASQRIQCFELSFATATGRVAMTDGSYAEFFCSAVAPVILAKIPGPLPRKWALTPPSAVAKLGYPVATTGCKDNVKWIVQDASQGREFRYAVVAAARRYAHETVIALTVTSLDDGPDPLALGRRRAQQFLARGFERMREEHEAWWRKFWSSSRLSIPDRKHLKNYYLGQYFYGAGSRLGAPPTPLQGVWTADNGELPPWKGDYHHDLNTQMTYAAYHTAGHFDEGRCLLDFLWALLPEFRRFARRFYGTPGAAVPSVMAINGKPLGGACMYTLQPTNAAWLGYLFYQHWRYTMDKGFLRHRAYPWCAEIGRSLLSLLEPDRKGILKLPLSSSPEIHNHTMGAWLTPNSNYDHDCLAALFGALAEMADCLGRNPEASAWRRALAGLGERAADTKKGLMLSPDEVLVESHRHFSHSMSIHPFSLMSMEGSEHDRAIIQATCRRYDLLGTRKWVGFSFPWMACLRARVGDGEAALRHLDTYQRAFTSRNGFHVNGDQLKAGYSEFFYRPFTLEGNFLAAQAVHEMLLQSWGGVIRLFPAMPWRWHTASFDDLRAEGGYRVSARWKNNATAWLRVVANQAGMAVIRDNFNGCAPQWNRAGVKKNRGNWEVRLRAGEALEARMPAPRGIAPNVTFHAGVNEGAKTPGLG